MRERGRKNEKERIRKWKVIERKRVDKKKRIRERDCKRERERKEIEREQFKSRSKGNLLNLNHCFERKV